jgi:hypothetical protein
MSPTRRSAYRSRLIPPPSLGPEDGEAALSVLASRRAQLREAQAPSRPCRDWQRTAGGHPQRLATLKPPISAKSANHAQSHAFAIAANLAAPSFNPAYVTSPFATPNCRNGDLT